MSLPPPHEPCEPTPITLEGALIHIVGLILTEPDIEVLAMVGDAPYRFVLPQHSRTARKYWKSIGVVDVGRLSEGAYESKDGFGPLRVEGTVVGRDSSDADSVGAIVLADVTIGGA